MFFYIIKMILKKNNFLNTISHKAVDLSREAKKNISQSAINLLIETKKNISHRNTVIKTYKKILGGLPYHNYNYLLFVPWLIKGGGDKYSIEYANTIAKLNPRKRVLVMSTTAVESVWADKLNDNVGFINIENIIGNETNSIKYDAIQKLIKRLSVSHIHIINSVFGYDFIESKQKYILISKIKIILTSFSLGIDALGEPAGYSRTYVPRAHNLASIITSDNQSIINDWAVQYGFSSGKMVVHRQPTDIKDIPAKGTINQPIKILWASRISYEKQPKLVARIGKLLTKQANIDMYGTIDRNSDFLEKDLPRNVNYIGPFDGFRNIDTSKYDIFLYTSLFDGMPNILIEAAQSRMPIIASNVGGISEFIIDNNTGILIDDIQNPSAYVKAIKKIIKDPSIGEKLATNALIKIKTDFNRDQYIQAVKNMLIKLKYL